MRLQLGPNWAIDWDGQCYHLIHFAVITGEGKGAFKVKAENIGKTKEVHCGYYGMNFRAALTGYLNKSMLEGDGTCDVAGLLARLDQLEATIKGAPVPKQPERQDAPEAEAAPAAEPAAPVAEPSTASSSTLMDL